MPPTYNILRRYAESPQRIHRNLTIVKDLGWQKYTENKEYYTFSLLRACLLWVTYVQQSVVTSFLKLSLNLNRMEFLTTEMILSAMGSREKNSSIIFPSFIGPFTLLPSLCGICFFRVKLGGSQGFTTGITIPEKQSDTFNLAKPCSFPLIFQQDPRETKAEISLFSPRTLIHY